MPILNWLGKDKVINYAAQVNFHVLNHKYNFGGKSENKIIHGDNLLALKSLLPLYEGRVKCIYIDPPYNTGNEGWIYNDNVNSPQIQKWLGQVVGREGEDFSRHDKWLCMMYPRLKLLKQLLADDGAIFISIDDNEQAALKFICDEIFGSQNFVSNVIWEKKYSPQNDAKYLSDSHDFILVYAKNKSVWRPNLLPRTAEMDARYKNPDNDPRGVWKPSPLHAKSGTNTDSYKFPNGVNWTPPAGTFRRYSEDTLKKLYDENKIYFGKDGKSTPQFKRFLTEVKQGLVSKTIWKRDEVGDTHEAKNEVRALDILFDTPKPTRLIERILQIATDKNSIVLDSFAGSGTTAHAVINLNAQDGGNRKFILVELESYAENITAERVKRVGGNFDFYEVGEEIFIDDELNENLPLEKIHEYIWQTETHTPYKKIFGDCEEFLGVHKGTAYYFKFGTLDYEFLPKIKTRADEYVIFAESCAIDAEFLYKNKIEFRKIPRDILKN
ncbi:MAG: site-specific DNA-methyltransferase [Selenomonadaceae bacterium]|nr:site-specific DNA-methyltransferase [Selenomonadaceae bacterium]